jgi:hypothetical protein
MHWGDCTGLWWTVSHANRAAGYFNPWCRRAYGRGLGFGSGFRYYQNEPFHQPTPDEERSYLEAMARDLEEELKSLRDQIEKLRSRA